MDTMTPQALTLEISRRFAATPERVFDAWLTKDWGRWLPPRGARCTVLSIDPRVGGRWHLTMTMADGRDIEIVGEYRELVRPQRLVTAWTGSYNNQETVLTLTFQPDGDGTLMTLRQDGFVDAQQRDGYDQGWNGADGSFDKLAAMLAKAS